MNLSIKLKTPAKAVTIEPNNDENQTLALIMPIMITDELSGERGIRTPGTFRYNGFQDHRIRPLCHLSSQK